VDGPGGAPYLAAHRYNDYTGRGWQSDVNTIHPDNDGAETFIAPQIELDPGELVPASSRFSAERDKTEYTMELQRPRGSLLFAPEMFVSSDLGTNLVVSWDDVEETVDVQQIAVDDVPSELATLVTMLQEADFTPPPPPEPTPDPDATPLPEGEEPAATPTPEVDQLPLPESAAITAERLHLSERNIIVSYTIDPSTFRVSTMTYAGTFPVYSDVEAVHARDGLDSDSAYTVETLVTDVTNEQLRQAGQRYPSSVTSRYLSLPDTVTQRTRDLARAISSGAANPYDAAKEIETYLRTNITYSENIPFPPPEVDVVDHVLFTDQRGYCEYYSSAFIVMMRSLGIPSRMAVGFFPTDEEEDGGYLYRELNAHAWPEVYFEGYGWIGFEPTAARSEVSRAPVEAGGDGPARPGDARFPGEGRLSDSTFEDQMFLEENMGMPAGSGGVAATGDEISTGQIITRAVIGGLMLLTIIVLFLWLRGMRGLSPTNQFYAKLSRGAGWGGVSRDPSMTPNEYANSVGEVVPGSRGPAVFLTDLYVQETYGQRKLAQSELMRARQAWLRLRGVLFKHFFVRLRPWGRHATAAREESDW
jgi:transglutaminase-like putative cysteine protease